MSQDVGVNCCQEIGNELIENIIEDETMETTAVERATHERERSALTCNDYLQMIETEEERIEEIENEIGVKTLELENVNNSIEEKERERLEEIKATYEAFINRRKDKEERLQQLEKKLEDRRNYLNSLREDDYVENYTSAHLLNNTSNKLKHREEKYKTTYMSNNITKTYF